MAVIFRAPGWCRGQRGYQERRRQLAFQSVPKISCLNSLATEIVPYPAAKGIKEEAFLLRASTTTPPPGLQAQPSPPAVLRAQNRRWAVKGDGRGLQGQKIPQLLLHNGQASPWAPVLLSQATGEFRKPLCPGSLNDLVTHE